MEAISLIHALPNTKEEIKDFTAKVKEAIMAGNSDPIHEAIYITAIQKVAEVLRKDPDIQNLVVEELMKYDRGTTQMGSTTVEIAETGVKYDYQEDPILQELEQKKLSVMNAIKDRQEILKSLKTEVADTETGEIMKPAVKTSSTNYKITIK